VGIRYLHRIPGRITEQGRSLFLPPLLKPPLQRTSNDGHQSYIRPSPLSANFKSDKPGRHNIQENEHRQDIRAQEKDNGSWVRPLRLENDQDRKLYD